MAKKAKTEIEILISGDNQSKKAFDSIDRSLKNIDNSAKEAKKSFGAMDVAIGGIAANIATAGIDMAMGAVTDTINQTVNATNALQKSLMFEGLDDSGLQAVSADLIYLQDAFGMEMPEAVNAADRVMTQFGTSATDAMDAVRLGADMNLDRYGDLTDTLNEYSQDFADLGFTAQETMAIINSGLESGAMNTDVIGDAFNEFGIRLKDPGVYDSLAKVDNGLANLVARYQDAEGTVSEAEIFSQIRDELLAIEDPLERNAMGVALFGTKWEDMGQSAMESILSTSQALETGEMSVEDYATSQQTLEQSIASVKAEIQAAFVPALNELMQTLTPLIQEYGPQIAEWFGTNVPVALDGATQALGAVSTAVQFLTPLIDIVIALFNQSVRVIDLVIGVLVNLAAVFTGAISPMQAVINIGNDVIDVFRGIFDMVGSVISKVFGLNNAFASLKPPKWLSSIGDTLSGAAKSIGIKGFADGGTFTGGKPIIVGERGPEMILPRASGTVVPNNQLSGSRNISMSINVQGNADQSTVSQIEQVLNRTVDKLIGQGNL